MMINAIKLRPVSDWQEVDTVYSDNGDVDVVWVEDMNSPLELSNTIRFNTPWTGDAPDFVDADGQPVKMTGVYCDFEYYFEVNDGGQIRVWERIIGQSVYSIPA